MDDRLPPEITPATAGPNRRNRREEAQTQPTPTVVVIPPLRTWLTRLQKPPRDPLNRQFYLPRLPREHYQGDAVVFWTLTTFDRAGGWLGSEFHRWFRELSLHVAAREGLVCPVYCLMPDHLHMVWMGLRRETDQLNGMAFLRTHLEPALAPARFQPQAQDEVLRSEQRAQEAFARVCFYVAANPVRAGLVTEVGAWPYTGCVVAGIPKLDPRAEDYWEKFWKLYDRMRQPDAGEICRPPVG